MILLLIAEQEAPESVGGLWLACATHTYHSNDWNGNHEDSFGELLLNVNLRNFLLFALLGQTVCVWKRDELQ